MLRAPEHFCLLRDNKSQNSDIVEKLCFIRDKVTVANFEHSVSF